MTDALAKALEAAIETCGLLGITLFATNDGRWQAATSKDRRSWQITLDADPVAALTRALPAADTTDDMDAAARNAVEAGIFG